MKPFKAFVAIVALLPSTANAFWRMPCRGRTGLLRLDPIVDPGLASTHSHTLHGGSNIGETTTYEQLRASECTSCQFDDDKSGYWTPSMHFVHDNGTTEIVPQIGGMLAYYLLFGDNLKAFPAGFEMLSGDTQLRNFTGPVPDPPLSAWTDADRTQLLLGQKSIGFNCMNYQQPPEGSRYRHFMPTKDYMDQHCADGIRAELMFPSCWNGKDLQTADHKSHMAYPSEIDGGTCPNGFDVRLPTLFYETIWNTNAYNGVPGQFLWSNGDPTGYGYHGDFINGWNIDTLQAAVNDCTDPSGLVEQCQHFSPHLQTEDKQEQCKIQDAPQALENENCDGPSEGLCGNVPVQYGPQYAKPLVPGVLNGQPTAAPIMLSAAPVPTLSYASARSMITDQYGGGISVYDVQPSAVSGAPAPDAVTTYEPDVPVAPSDAPAPNVPVPDAPATPSNDPAVAALAVTPTDTTPAAPAVTSLAVIQSAPTPDADGSIISSTTYTSAGTVYVVAFKEVQLTVTIDAYKKQRRHGHGANHGHYRQPSVLVRH